MLVARYYLEALGTKLVVWVRPSSDLRQIVQATAANSHCSDVMLHEVSTIHLFGLSIVVVGCDDQGRRQNMIDHTL